MVDPKLTAAMVEYVVMAVYWPSTATCPSTTDRAGCRTLDPRRCGRRRSGVSASWGSASSARPPRGPWAGSASRSAAGARAQGPRRDHDLHGCRRTRRFPVRHRHPGLPAASHPGDPRPPEPRPVRPPSPPAPALVNTGRGGHLVEADILAALDSGRISGAILDVLATEPPPADHPLLAHPLVLATPTSPA